MATSVKESALGLIMDVLFAITTVAAEEVEAPVEESIKVRDICFFRYGYSFSIILTST